MTNLKIKVIRKDYLKENNRKLANVNLKLKTIKYLPINYQTMLNSLKQVNLENEWSSNNKTLFQVKLKELLLQNLRLLKN